MIVPQIKTAWQLENDCEIIDIDKGFLVACFYSRDDYLKVLEGGPWVVFGHYLTISKWCPNFTPSESEIASTLIWIRFPELPLEMFRERTLMAMGNTIGKALKVDMTTNDVARGRFACVCVEISLTRPLTPTLMIMGPIVQIEYEGLSQMCFGCGLYRHSSEDCPKKHPVPEPTTTPALAEPATH